MKQYSDIKQQNYSFPEIAQKVPGPIGSMTFEALLGKSRDKLFTKVYRRRSAYFWYVLQIENRGQPWMFHCGG